MGAGMYEIARSLAADADFPRLLGLIIDRLAVDRPGRAFFYLPPETPIELERFVRDFTAFAQVDDFGHPQFGSLERPVHSAILSGLGRVRRSGLERVELAHQLATEGSASVGPDRLEAVLGYGHRQILALAYGFAGRMDRAAAIARVDLDEAAVQNNLTYIASLRNLDDKARIAAVLGYSGRMALGNQMAVVRAGETEPLAVAEAPREQPQSVAALPAPAAEPSPPPRP